MAKINNDLLNETVAELLKYSLETKKRNFTETVELQVNLKNYDPRKDKRFSGSTRLPFACKPAGRVRFCVLGTQQHCDIAAELGLDFRTVDDLKSLNRNKKVIKRTLTSKYDAFLASQTLIRQIPRLLGPALTRAGKFPTLLSGTDDISEKVAEVEHTVKFQMKKVLCLAAAIGHVEMSHEDLIQNIKMAINFLVSLLKKNWQNVKTLYVKSSMGPSHRLY
jgi:large subunit ribosomal protein L10Ae